MQKKTIQRVINKKINDWLSSITDEDLKKDLQSKIIVTGGCIASMLGNEPVNDYDIYLTDKDIVKRVSQYYCDIFNENNKDSKTNINTSAKAWVLDGQDVQDWKDGKIQLSSFAYEYEDIDYSTYMEWDSDERITGPSGMLLNTSKEQVKIIINSNGIAEDSDAVADSVEYDVNEYLDNISDIQSEIITPNNLNPTVDTKENYKPVFLSANAITLSDKIQIVIRFYGTATEIHENYDFVHCTNYYESSTNSVTLNLDALEAIMNKTLLYRGSKFPIASIIRTRKFIKRGFHINAGQYLKMALQINKLDLNNIYVLEDQLVGVDSIYFLNFIHQVRKQIEEGKKIELSGDYVMSVIDKVFG